MGMPGWRRKQRTYPAWFTLEITRDDWIEHGSQDKAFAAKRAAYESASDNGDDVTIMGGSMVVDFDAKPDESAS